MSEETRRRWEKRLWYAFFIWLVILNLYLAWGLYTGLDWTTDPILGPVFDLIF